jgi:hypothetical protein
VDVYSSEWHPLRALTIIGRIDRLIGRYRSYFFTCEVFPFVMWWRERKIEFLIPAKKALCFLGLE